MSEQTIEAKTNMSSTSLGPPFSGSVMTACGDFASAPTCHACMHHHSTGNSADKVLVMFHIVVVLNKTVKGGIILLKPSFFCYYEKAQITVFIAIRL